MEKRVSSRAIIIEDDSIYLIFRRKEKLGKVKEYYVIPGGGLEDNETLEENVKREIKEEFNCDIKVNEFLGTFETDDTIENYFYCEIIDGTPVLSGEEKDRMSNENYYEIRKIKISDIDSIDVFAKDMIMNAFKNI